MIGGSAEQTGEIMAYFKQMLVNKYMHKCGDDFEMPSYEETEEFIAGLNLDLDESFNFDDNVYNFLLTSFNPEDPNSVGELLNWVGAT
jgi:hypothetical protein